MISRSLDVSGVKTLRLRPLPEYNCNIAYKKKLWLYEGRLFLRDVPLSINIQKADKYLPIRILRTQEIIIRDKETGRLLLAVFRNRIGKDTIEYIYQTIQETLNVRRKVYRDKQFAALQQGSLIAAGYLCTRQCGIFTHVRNVKKEFLNTFVHSTNEKNIVASVALLYNYAMKYFPNDLVEDVKEFLVKHNLPRLDNNQYGVNEKKSGFNIKYKNISVDLPYELGLGEAYIASNYSTYMHTDNNFLKYAWACVCKKG